MFGIKEPKELDEYPYNVCEIMYCEEESTDDYEDEDKFLNVCDKHYRMLNANKWTLS